MKIIKRIINFKTKTFQVRMQLDTNTDDCWNLFNLISKGDLVYGQVRRNVAKDTLTGLVKREQKTFKVLLEVQSFDYDPDSDEVRVNGINRSENKWIGMG